MLSVPTPESAVLKEECPEAAQFREAMSRVATSVHAVTTDGPAGRHGATATSVASLTDDPPTLIVCLNLRSRAYRIASRNGVVAINTLAAEHEALARAFATSSGGALDDRFSHGTWDSMATGAPTLIGALASFDGRIVRETLVGSHAALFVELDAVRLGDAEAGSLAYRGRAYHPFPHRG